MSGEEDPVAARPGEEEINQMLEEARALAYVRPMGRYPGWHFGVGEESGDPSVRARRRIWEYFNRHRLEVPLEYQWWDGLRVNLYLGNDLSQLLFIGGCADPNEFSVLDKILKPGMVVVDAGANEGLYSLFAARRVGREGTVLAFEPSNREFGRLVRNIQANGLDNIRASQMALSNRDGEVELRIAGYQHEGHNTLGEFAYPGVETLANQRVTARQLDRVVAESGVGRLDFIKIDVEGAETRVIEGAQAVLERFRPVILFEASDRSLQSQGSSLDALLSLLESCGYLVYAFDSSGLPVPAAGGCVSDNMLATPSEKPLPAAWCETFQEPYLSFVVTTRNDDHGGGLRRRTQTFVNALIGQCKRHGLTAELIVVEWNPPPDRAPLREALDWPTDTSPCQVRFIEVPASVHACFRHARAFPLFQMIAKNVGIRRARGKYILATNIDILFSDELMRFLAAGRLEPGYMYRIDRHDVMADVPVDAPVEEQLAYCNAHQIRVNTREGTVPVSPQGCWPQVANDIASAHRGISLGRGWFPPDWQGKELFRWVQNDAELQIVAPEGESPWLALDVAPGPGVGGASFTLTVWDETGSAVAEAEVNGRSRVLVPLNSSSGPRRLRLHCAHGGRPSPGELRILNFRVFRCEWEYLGDPSNAAGSHASNDIPGVSRIGVPRKIAGVIRRAAENGPVIQVSVPVPHVLRRFLRFCLRIKDRPGGPAGQQEPRGHNPLEEDGELSRVAYLHTNACGDFTLLARKDWFDLRAYPEWDLFSFHIDAVFCYAAHHGGVGERVLEDPMRIYHIEHGSGSGWTPEGAERLFQRLREKGVSWLEYSEVVRWVDEMRRLNCPMIFNHESWGLADCDLPETRLGN